METVSLAVVRDASVDVPSGLSLEELLTWISDNAVEGGMYTITIENNETISPKTFSYNGKNVSIILEGGASERTVSLSADGSMFTVGSGVTLTLGGNVTLRGRSDNTDSLVKVNNGGALVMNDGSKISGNAVRDYAYNPYADPSASASAYGGGVYVSGTFTMNGGEISGNTAYAYASASAGAYASAYASASAYGGGVYVYGGTFTMNGGKISGNTADAHAYAHASDASASAYGDGGGVYVSGTFTKSGNSTIYGSDASAALKNTAIKGDSYGHAVYVSSSKKRNTTAGAGVTLDSSKSGAAGGWE
jgi:hypothetical protein